MTWNTLNSSEVLLGFLALSLITAAFIYTLKYLVFRQNRSAKVLVRRQVSWTRHRAHTFLFGLIIAILVCTISFSWTTYGERTYATYQTVILDDELPQFVPPTRRKKKVIPPPPVIKPTEIEPIKDEPIFDSEMDFVEEDISKATSIDSFATEEKTVSKPHEKPAPLPLPEIDEPDIPEIFDIAEEMPLFPGCSDLNTKEERKACSDDKLLKYIYEHIKYPVVAKENGIEGKVYVEFIIDKNGRIVQEKIRRDIGAGLGAEALGVIKGMKGLTWTPGSHQGRKVSVRLTLPIDFELH